MNSQLRHLYNSINQYIELSESKGTGMLKTILVTGATDGIGLETARRLISLGHKVLLHGRNPDKLKAVEKELLATGTGDRVETYVADLSRLTEVESLASAVAENHTQLDVLINNAGVFSTGAPMTADGLDIRFVVNTIAPYLLTQKLLPLFDPSGRIVNVSSAAQAPVSIETLAGKTTLSDQAAYAQSKLAITMWSRSMALSLGRNGPAIIAVNPGSLLGSKMVKDAYGMDGGDLGIGADILVRATVADEFATASGLYFDNDSHRFADPHRDALEPQKCKEVVNTIEELISRLA